MGGIVNSGTLSAGGSGILAIGVSTFTGGITNSGAISAGVSGIDLPTSGHSSAAIANSGKITGAATSKGTNEINLVPELAPSATLPLLKLGKAANDEAAGEMPSGGRGHDHGALTHFLILRTAPRRIWE